MRASILHLALVLGGCANACGEAEDPLRSEQHATLPQLPPASEAPPPEGEPIAPKELASALPEALGVFRARGEPTPREVPLANGKLTAARRSYTAESRTLTLEITDIVHSPQVSGLLQRAKDMSKKDEHASFEGSEVQGYRAVVQWHGAGRMGLVNTLVEDRFLVNFRLRPVDDATLVKALAEELPLGKLIELKAKNEGKAEAEAEAETETATGAE